MFRLDPLPRVPPSHIHSGQVLYLRADPLTHDLGPGLNSQAGLPGLDPLPLELPPKVTP